MSGLASLEGDARRLGGRRSRRRHVHLVLLILLRVLGGGCFGRGPLGARSHGSNPETRRISLALQQEQHARKFVSDKRGVGRGVDGELEPLPFRLVIA